MPNVHEKGSLPLANKYRPRLLADVVGQEVVKRYIVNAIGSDKVHHAYLFSGPSGTGKTTVARIFASCVNAAKGPTVNPDLSSDEISRNIVDGGCVDVRELDAASNRSIDDIREIRQEIQYAPLQARKRFVIIDEAHGLTGAAAEAALKMIEEPPSHTIFVLCTTEPEKLKDTIYGRCISLNFLKIPDETVAARLQQVCEQESMRVDEDALSYIAKSSAGCMRLALQSLEKCYMCKSAETDLLDADTCVSVLRKPGAMLALSMIESIVDKDVQGGLLAANREIVRGVSPEMIVGTMVEQLRNIMIAKSCSKPSSLLSVTGAEKEAIKRLLPKMSVATVLDIIQAAGDFSRGAASGMNPAALLDALVVRSVVVSHRNANGEQKKAPE